MLVSQVIHADPDYILGTMSEAQGQYYSKLGAAKLGVEEEGGDVLESYRKAGG